MKSGEKTTEFAITLVMIVTGGILIVLGHCIEGTALLGAAGVGYQHSRGQAKRGA